MVSENNTSQHGGNHQPGIKPDEVDHRHGDGGIMMANVPQDVPVEKAIKQDTRNNTAGMMPVGRVDLAAWATKGPVPRASHVSPMAKARIIRLARGKS